MVTLNVRGQPKSARTALKRLVSFTSSSPKTALQGIAAVEVPAITSVVSIQSGRTLLHLAEIVPPSATVKSV